MCERFLIVSVATNQIHIHLLLMIIIQDNVINALFQSVCSGSLPDCCTGYTDSGNYIEWCCDKLAWLKITGTLILLILGRSLIKSISFQKMYIDFNLMKRKITRCQIHFLHKISLSRRNICGTHIYGTCAGQQRLKYFEVFFG